MNEIIEQIAKRHLHVETLEVRNSDSLDFYDCSIWAIQNALEKAYKAGYKKALTETKQFDNDTGVCNNTPILTQHRSKRWDLICILALKSV